jgi:hypothetical protein
MDNEPLAAFAPRDIAARIILLNGQEFLFEKHNANLCKKVFSF